MMPLKLLEAGRVNHGTITLTMSQLPFRCRADNSVKGQTISKQLFNSLCRILLYISFSLAFKKKTRFEAWYSQQLDLIILVIYHFTLWDITL
ncbi:hypothetical protein GDO86_003056 [Hymenochirus boettgeri]|uniref:Uncharacterized protein n=1 Tax=Hymenochirus boettgeri TaxID=247094 RepID=A0A8T2JZE4_9PIPI|nr:hypothetical protein GDO86_003056 [Hymenochirus boettgeri]